MNHLLSRRSSVLPTPRPASEPSDPAAVYVVGLLNDKGVVSGLTHTTPMTRGEAALEVARWERASLRRYVLCRVVIDGQEPA